MSNSGTTVYDNGSECFECGMPIGENAEKCEVCKDYVLACHKETQKSVRDGYGGVLPNGRIVDRRTHPDAMPIPANSYLGVPEPKELKP